MRAEKKEIHPVIHFAYLRERQRHAPAAPIVAGDLWHPGALCPAGTVGTKGVPT